VGDFLMSRNRKPLYRLAKSPVLWERRVAILAITGSSETTIRRYAGNQRILLRDKEDLIQKAVGWMLRESEKGPAC